MELLIIILLGLISGYMVALISAKFIRNVTITNLPGGSISAGVMTALIQHGGFFEAVIGGVAGFCGWLLLLYVISRKPKLTGRMYCTEHGLRPKGETNCKEQSKTFWHCQVCKLDGELYHYRKSNEIRYEGSLLIHTSCNFPVEMRIEECGKELIDEVYLYNQH